MSMSRWFFMEAQRGSSMWPVARSRGGCRCGVWSNAGRDPPRMHLVVEAADCQDAIDVGLDRDDLAGRRLRI
jgi:hypothetical protein